MLGTSSRLRNTGVRIFYASTSVSSIAINPHSASVRCAKCLLVEHVERALTIHRKPPLFSRDTAWRTSAGTLCFLVRTTEMRPCPLPTQGCTSKLYTLIRVERTLFPASLCTLCNAASTGQRAKFGQ